jgi:hypothetical protein
MFGDMEDGPSQYAVRARNIPGSFIDGICKTNLRVRQRPWKLRTEAYTVPLKNRQHGSLLAREAYSALLNLKTLVELAVNKTHIASMETVGLAINTRPIGDFWGALRTAVDTLESSIFESAVSEARAKIEVAVAWYEELHEK